MTFNEQIISMKSCSLAVKGHPKINCVLLPLDKFQDVRLCLTYHSFFFLCCDANYHTLYCNFVNILVETGPESGILLRIQFPSLQIPDLYF